MAEKDIYSVADMKKQWKYKKLFDGTIVLIEYKKENETVEIPPRIGRDSVSRIVVNEDSDYGEVFNDEVKSVHFSEGVSYIDDGVFSGANREVSLPKSVLVIHKFAFNDFNKPNDFDEKYECIGDYYYRKEGMIKKNGMIIIDGILCGSDGIDPYKCEWNIPDDLEVSSYTESFPYLYYKRFERHPFSKENLMHLEVGKEISFGYFPADHTGIVSPIVWEVKCIEEGKALLLSKDILVTMPYDIVAQENRSNPNINWNNSKIREWLNGVYYEFAFSDDEKSVIMDTEHEKCVDRVFLLGEEEAKKINPNDAIVFLAKMGEKKSNSYSFAREADTNYDHLWWLRNYGNNNNGDVMSVYPTGEVDRKGCSITMRNGVCPAIWVATV